MPLTAEDSTDVSAPWTVAFLEQYVVEDLVACPRRPPARADAVRGQDVREWLEVAAPAR